MPEALFAFEEAERVLEAFARGPRPAAFRRAWVKFRFMLLAYAYVDHSTAGRRPGRQELAWAWEDAQMAFVGHGEQCLIGAVIQLWVTLAAADQKAFAAVVKEAFDGAEAATPKRAPRRYLSRYRRKPVRLPEEGFVLQTILPVRGPSIREWALDQDMDPDAVEEQWYWLELADRELVEEERPAPGRHLRLVADNDRS